MVQAHKLPLFTNTIIFIMAKIKLTEQQLAKLAREQKIKKDKANKKYIPPAQRNQSGGATGPAGSKPKV